MTSPNKGLQWCNAIQALCPLANVQSEHNLIVMMPATSLQWHYTDFMILLQGCSNWASKMEKYITSNAWIRSLYIRWHNHVRIIVNLLVISLWLRIYLRSCDLDSLLHSFAVYVRMWRLVGDTILYFVQLTGACLFWFYVPQVHLSRWKTQPGRHNYSRKWCNIKPM